MSAFIAYCDYASGNHPFWQTRKKFLIIGFLTELDNICSLKCRYVLLGKGDYSAVLSTFNLRLQKVRCIKYMRNLKRNYILPVLLMGGMWGLFFAWQAYS